MATQLLSIGPAFVITQNVVYALPAQACVITTSAACDTSNDGTAWTAFTSGSVSIAKFIRCTTASPTVTCSKAVAGSGGGVSLPLVLSSAVQKEPGIVLIDQSQPANQKRWRIWPMTGGYLNFDIENDDGSLVNRIYISRSSAGLVSNTTIQAIEANIQRDLILVEVPFSSLVSIVAVGALANISDSTVNTIGATIAGGGTNHVLARYNGTIWKVIGV